MSRKLAWKKIALQEAREEIIEIQDDGHDVVMYTDYHWKIDGIDVWPSARKYMRYGKVRHYQHLKEVIQP